MSAPDPRLDRDFCARGFVRAAQYFTNMLAGADVLAESRDLVRGIFAPEIVCFCGGARCEDDCRVHGADRELVLRAVGQVFETGFMAMESLERTPPVALVVMPIAVRGRTESALVVGYEGTRTLPPHALEALLGVAGLVGATLARQRSERELVALAEERAARAIAEVMERRALLLAEASKALSASFDYESALTAVGRLAVPQLADSCSVELYEDGRPAPAPPELPASILVVPITARQTVFGAITLDARASGRRYGSEDRALAEEIGRRAGTAIENARLYREAQQAIGLRDEFLAVAAHELKTPLTGLTLVIDGAARAMEKLPNAPPPMRRKIEAISRQSRRLADLVRNLLDVSRIRAGRFELVLAPVDLAELVLDVTERHADEAAQAGCALEVAGDEAVPGRWDRSALDHVVSNLVSNAIKYGAGKPIEVSVSRHGEVARLTVRDRGIGIAPVDQERIFRRFERAVTHSGFVGLGLGLWIVSDIVARLGGSIRVESALGEGACFTVELPLEPPEAGSGEAGS